MSIFVCNSAVASAKCPYDVDGLHHFGKPVGTGEGYTDYLTHAHLIGYNAKGEEVYLSCQVTMTYEYYISVCWQCGETEPGSRHLESKGEDRKSVV